MSNKITSGAPKLSVWKTVCQAYRFVWQEKSSFIKIAVIPMLFFVLGEAALDFHSSGRFIAEIFEIEFTRDYLFYFSFPYSALVGLYQILIITAFSVIWHRLFLIKSEPQRTRNLFLWSKRHQKFIGALIILSLMVFAVSTLITFNATALIVDYNYELFEGNFNFLFSLASSFLLNLLVVTVGIVISMRWSMVFPSIAVGQLISFRKSWELTRGNGFRLCAIGILSSIPIHIVAGVVLIVLLPWLGHSGVMFVKPAFYFLPIVVGVSALSAAYKVLCEAPEDPLNVFD